MRLRTLDLKYLEFGWSKGLEVMVQHKNRENKAWILSEFERDEEIWIFEREEKGDRLEK